MSCRFHSSFMEAPNLDTSLTAPFVRWVGGRSVDVVNVGSLGGDLVIRPHTVLRRSARASRTVGLALLSALLLATSVVASGAVADAAPTGPSAPDQGSGPAYLNPHLSTDRRVADLLRRMTLEEKVGQMTQTERGAVFDNPSPDRRVAGRLGAVRRRLDAAGQRTGGVARDGQRLPGAGAQHPPADPAHLRHRRRPRARHRAGRDDLPAQHRARGHPRRPPRGGDRRGHRRGDAGHRHPVELRAVPVRHAATSGGAAATRATARTRRLVAQLGTAIIDGLQGRDLSIGQQRARDAQALRR